MKDLGDAILVVTAVIICILFTLYIVAGYQMEAIMYNSAIR